MTCTDSLSWDIDDKANELINIIKTRFITSSGLLARNYPVTERTLFDNFDDIVPFFLYMGETDFLLEQINKIHKSNHNLLSLCARGNLLITRDMDEWFGGLYALWEVTNDQKTFSLIKNSIRFIDQNLMRKNILAPAYDLNKGPITSFYEPWSSGLLETICEMRSEFPKLFDRAQNVFKYWLKDEYFREFGLFPYRIFYSNFHNSVQKSLLSNFRPLQPYSKFPQCCSKKSFHSFLQNKVALSKFNSSNGWYSQMMKSNSTCAFTMLEYFKATGDRLWFDSLSKWIENAKEKFVKNNKVYMNYLPKKELRYFAMARAAFIFSDVICDTSFFLPSFRDYLPLVKNIIDYQWENRLENGMIPFTDEGLFAHIDDQIDLSISFRRFGELMDDKEYINRSQKLINDMISAHYTPDGFLSYSGETSSNIIDPKYNALVLKGMINLKTLDESLYSQHYLLFKDR